MITAIIIDDEIRSCKTLAKLIELADAEVVLLGQANNIKSGFELIKEKKPELVFLDINMPGGNGFELIEKFSSIDFKIIFTTAHDEFAISAIKAGAFDYLLKPISLDDIKETLARVKVSPNNNNGEDYAQLLKLIKSNKHSISKIPIASMNGITFLDSKNIIRCSADNNYTVIHLKDNEQIISSKTLKEYDVILSAKGFFRAHRSHLINIDYISKYLKGRPALIEMEDGYHVELSQSKKASFLELFENS